MVSDALSYLLTLIRNGYTNRRYVIKSSNISKINLKLLNLLREEGYIRGYSCQQTKDKTSLYIFLKYSVSNKPIMCSIQRISKPGRRIYINYKVVTKLHNNLETFILSSPRGLITDKTALKYKQGGELVCKIISSY
jgi:small subunit ribosomal protein S8